MVDRTGELWMSPADVLYVCFGEDPADTTNYLFQAAASELFCSVRKKNINIAASVHSRWWRKVS